MSDCSRTVDDVRTFLQSSKGFDSQQMMRFYDSWAETYEQDVTLMSYRAPHLAVDFLSKNFSGSPEEAQVLDVTCGSGLVAKQMVELGFRHFVGVDGSKGMLEQAAPYWDQNHCLHRLVCLMLLSSSVVYALNLCRSALSGSSAKLPNWEVTSACREWTQSQSLETTTRCLWRKSCS